MHCSANTQNTAYVAAVAVVAAAAAPAADCFALQCKTRLETHFKNVDAVVGYYTDCICEVRVVEQLAAHFKLGDPHKLPLLVPLAAWHAMAVRCCC